MLLRSSKNWKTFITRNIRKELAPVPGSIELYQNYGCDVTIIVKCVIDNIKNTKKHQSSLLQIISEREMTFKVLKE